MKEGRGLGGREGKGAVGIPISNVAEFVCRLHVTGRAGCVAVVGGTSKGGGGNGGMI